jgi:hypothetical protein
MGIFWELSLADFLLVTIVLAGGAAYMAGRAVAMTWRPIWQLGIYMFILSLFVRFIHFALFHGTLLSFHYWLVDLVWLLIVALVGYRIKRTQQMTTQYRWLYEKTGPFTWKDKTS